VKRGRRKKMAYKNDEKVIFEKEFQKSDQSKVILKILKKGENFSIDIREWVETETYTGPTKKGIRFLAGDENWSNFVNIIDDMDEILEQEL
jgi:hypothetical protein